MKSLKFITAGLLLSQVLLLSGCVVSASPPLVAYDPGVVWTTGYYGPHGYWHNGYYHHYYYGRGYWHNGYYHHYR